MGGGEGIGTYLGPIPPTWGWGREYIGVSVYRCIGIMACLCVGGVLCYKIQHGVPLEW